MTTETFPGAVVYQDAGASQKIDPGFDGTIVYTGGVLDISGMANGGGYTDVLSWSASLNTFSMFTHGGRVAHFGFYDLVGGYDKLQVYQVGSEFYASKGAIIPSGAKLLLGGEFNNAPPVATVAIYDTTTSTAIPDTFSQPYTGPVAGIKTEVIDITEHSLNITAKADNLFIKTGYGNDAIALQGGTNVVDAGGGSNFITPGTGFDTIFLNMGDIPRIPTAAGSVPGSIWDTVQGFSNTGHGFHHGDAVTLWDVGPSTKITWQHAEGALGYQGETMHALLSNGAMGSLTFAGFSNHAGLSMSYGKSAEGTDYLYVKAA